MRTIDILTPVEKKAFDNPPHFSFDEQSKFFALPPLLQAYLQTIVGPINKVGFILLFGYCQASSRFYTPIQFRETDVERVCTDQNIALQQVRICRYHLRTSNNHKKVIREYLTLQSFDATAKEFFLQSIQDRVARHQSPKQILQDVTELLCAKKIEIPGYNRFSLVITQAISDFEKNLLQQITDNLAIIPKEKLEALLSTDKSTISTIAQLKTISHSRKPRSIQISVKKFRKIQKLHDEMLPLIQTLNLHIDTVRHYATWIRKASLHQIQQLQTKKRYLYLICFLIHQYQLRQDILGDIVLTSVKATENAVAKAQKESVFQQNDQKNQTLQLLSTARVSYKSQIKKIEEITLSPLLNDSEKIIGINKILEEQHQRTEETQLDDMEKKNLEELNKQDYYNVLEDLSLKLQNRVADIFRYLQFDTSEEITPLLKAIQHYQKKKGKITHKAPTEFLSEKEKQALYDENEKFRPSLYKSLLYLHTAEAMKSGVVSLKPAYRYLSLENYMHDKKHWEANKERLLEEAGLTQFADIDALLSKLMQELDERYIKTNEHINKAENEHIKFNPKGKLILSTPKVDKINVQSLSSIFAEQKYISILKVLSDIQRITPYLDCFRHHSVKDKKVLPQPSTFYAAIIGMGCNIGINKMANVSKGVSEDVLLNFVNWHMSLDNINAANQCILELFNHLSLAKIYQKDPNNRHSAGDGRKVELAVESLNANYSFKYFGSGIGSSLYSCIDEMNRVFYNTMISSSDREAAYVADAFLNNLSIKTNIHSTDTHGYSETIFCILHMLGIYFAPRIKNLKKAVLYSFEPQKVYEDKGYKILPQRYIDSKIIKEQWDDILRLMVTLKLKETTTSKIFKRLSSYSKQHPLYRALKEFGRIIKSLFILRYIDDVVLRQSIEKQLNRVELSNKFSKAIFFGQNQEIQYSSKEEQEMVVGCQRLIQNIIVLWNELYLSQKLAMTEDEEKRRALLAIIKSGSTLAWGHVNFGGEYDFTQEIEQYLFDLEKIFALEVA